MSQADKPKRDGGCAPTDCSAQQSDTPETDQAWKKSIDDTGAVCRMEPIWETMTRLERERDEARRIAAKWRDHWVSGDTLREAGGVFNFPWEKPVEQNA